MELVEYGVPIVNLGNARGPGDFDVANLNNRHRNNGKIINNDTIPSSKVRVRTYIEVKF